NERDTAKDSLASAAAVASNTPTLNTSTNTSPPPPPTPNDTTPLRTAVGSGSPAATQTDDETPADLTRCGGTGGMAIHCALASDPTLPRYVNTPRFAKDFKKASGQDLGEFLSK